VELSGEIFNNLVEHTTPILSQFFQEIDGLEGRDIAFIQIGYGLAPKPLTPENFIKRAPYANPETFRGQMDEAVERGWLESVDDGRYRLTPKAKETVEHLLGLADKTLAGVETLPDVDLKRIEQLLAKVVKKAHQLPEPAEKPGLALGETFDRDNSVPLVQARRRMLDLLAYRDDVHIAAWQPYGVSGQVWETLTYVWQGDAGTAAELADKLSYRHYDAGAYATALKDLSTHGWIARENGKYVITPEGQRLRQEAEDTTDRYFDAPWTALSESETRELKELLKKFVKAVKLLEKET
jgi:DNA-binding PadR family transcriptional regulator